MAVRFDVATDRVTYAGTLPNPADGFTLVCWAWVSVDTNANATIARLHVVAGDSTSVTMATDVDGLGGPAYFTAGGTVTNPTGMAVGEWRRLAWSRSSTTGRVYVAPEVGSTVLASGTVGGAANPTAITLGGRSVADSTESFNGRLAYVRLFGAELTQSAIEAEWASPVPVSTGSLFADWPLETAADLTDHSGNGRDLVAGSTAVTTEDGPDLVVTVTGSFALQLGGLTLGVTGLVGVLGSMTFNLGGLQLTLQDTQQRVRVSGREPLRVVTGREPRSRVTSRG